ncbi:hypothetical protein B0H65DRAFT_446253 [Neurospora tetraspora]|uniref:Uncharacterized protein n=1 Tax=Neurospora tetraspora TaxID=94610 RepID=A0AAE0MMX6_9PEZI|nr:hypothetical protein B0H65DRAFT_446253 [Neurospora tetraspora]
MKCSDTWVGFAHHYTDDLGERLHRGPTSLDMLHRPTEFRKPGVFIPVAATPKRASTYSTQYGTVTTPSRSKPSALLRNPLRCRLIAAKSRVFGISVAVCYYLNEELDKWDALLDKLDKGEQVYDLSEDLAISSLAIYRFFSFNSDLSPHYFGQLCGLLAAYPVESSACKSFTRCDWLYNVGINPTGMGKSGNLCVISVISPESWHPRRGIGLSRPGPCQECSTRPGEEVGSRRPRLVRFADVFLTPAWRSAAGRPPRSVVLNNVASAVLRCCENV